MHQNTVHIKHTFKRTLDLLLVVIYIKNITIFYTSFFKFKKLSWTLDQAFGPKYLKQFKPSLVLALSVIKFYFF